MRSSPNRLTCHLSVQQSRFIGVDPGFAVSWRFGMAMRVMNRVRKSVVSARRAHEFRELGWDVRPLAGAPHDMHIQMPGRLADLLDDVLRG